MSEEIATTVPTDNTGSDDVEERQKGDQQIFPHMAIDLSGSQGTSSL